MGGMLASCRSDPDTVTVGQPEGVRGSSGHKVWISVLLLSVQLITGMTSVSYAIVYPHYGACTMQ